MSKSGRALDVGVGWTFATVIALSPVVFLPTARSDVFIWPRVLVIGVLTVVAIVLLTTRSVTSAGFPVPVVRVVDFGLALMICIGVMAWLLSVDRSLSLAGEPLQYRGLAATLAVPVFVVLGRWVGAADHWVYAVSRPAIVAGAVVAGFALAQQARLDPWWNELPQGRSFSTLGQPNSLGAVLVVLGVIAAVSIPEQPRRWRGAAMVVSVAALLGVVASASRGAILGAIAAGLTVWLVRRPRLNLRRTILVLAAGGLVAVAVSPVRMAASNSIDRIVAAGDTSPGGSVAMRLDLWAVGVEMIRLRPVLGWGPDTYAIVFPEVDDRVLDAGSKAVLDQFRPESPHNLFLEVTQGAGLLGLGAMMTVIGGAVAMIIRGDDPRVLGLVLPVIVGYLVAAQFMTSEWASSTLFWLVLGVGVGRSVEVRARV